MKGEGGRDWDVRIHLFDFFQAGLGLLIAAKSLLRKGNEGEPDVNFRAAHVNFGGVMCALMCHSSVVRGPLAGENVGWRKSKSRRTKELKNRRIKPCDCLPYLN